MAGRKSLDQLLSNDRSVARSARGPVDLWDGHYGSAPSSKGKRGGSGFGRCYEGHPPLTMPGTSLVIYGGSCLSPAVEDADVYIGFDGGMRHTHRGYPWNVSYDEVAFRIPDMGVPSSAKDFHTLVDWTKEQLETGRKVHAGCIGGHGRTGMFLAALVSRYGEADAITYVRTHYCKKAVESSTQVAFLHDEFGIKKIGGSKAGGHGTSKGKGSATNRVESFPPMAAPFSIW